MNETKFNKRMDQFVRTAIKSSKDKEGNISDKDWKEICLIRELIGYAKELNHEVEDLKKKIKELEEKK